jgi:putative oxidoreductase
MERIFGPFHGGRTGLALLLLRFIVGLAFIFHGWPLAMDVTGFANRLNLPVFLAAVAAYTQVIGGFLLIVGLLTPLAAALLAFEMLVALFKVHIPAGDPFVNPQGKSYELAAVYLFAMAALLLTGPGAYSLDAWLTRQWAARPVYGRRRSVA